MTDARQLTDREFNELLQAELKRVNDLNRELERQIMMLQRQAEKMAEKIKSLGGTMEDPPPVSNRRRRPYYA